MNTSLEKKLPTADPFSTTQSDTVNFDDLLTTPSKSGAASMNDELASLFDTSAPVAQAAPQQHASAAADNIFSFDLDEQSPPDNANQQREPEEPQEGPQPSEPALLTFTCRKCSFLNEIEPPELLPEQFRVACSTCSKPITIVIESNANRAVQKSKEIFCSKCAHKLDHRLFCPSCGYFCPDYYVAEDPDETQRKLRVKRSSNTRIALANLKASFTWKRSERKSAPQIRQSAAASKSVGFSASLVKRLAILTTMLLVVGVAAFFFLKIRAEQKFVTDYVKTVYVLHAGSEAVIGAMSKMSNEWKAAADAGRAYIPGTDTTLAARLAKIDTEANKLFQQLQKVPGKYKAANSALLNLNAEYKSLASFAATKQTSLDQLNSRIETSDKAVKQKSQELKASLTPEMLKELEEARKKLRGFANF